MAHAAKDGKQFTNRNAARTHDMRQGMSQQKPQGDAMQSDDPQQLVQEHGPATEVNIKHAQTHAVTTTHSDGHQAMSEHPTAEAAHAYGATAAGCGGGY